MQCHGITVKGVRCKMSTADGYCKYHRAQANPSNSPIPSNHAGHIYIYTLKKFFDKQHTEWFKTRNLPNTRKKHKDEWSSYEAKRSKYILIKVGMTAQPIEKRIKQWEDKCKHDIMLVNPQTDKLIHPRGFLSLFRKLSIDKTSYITLSNQGGFYCSKNLGLAESEIHRILHRKYGKGTVYCKNCSDNTKAGGYNIHVEWFCILKSDLSFVYQTIDQICQNYAT